VVAIVFGINAANSKCSCPLCKWNSKLALAFDAVWPLDRSHEEAAECIKKKKEERQGYKNKAIFMFIPMRNIGIDPYMMRITGKLFFFLKIYIEVSVDRNSSGDLSKRPILKKLWDFIELECKITNPFYSVVEENGDTEIKIRETINKNERLLIIKKMFSDNRSLFSLFPENFKDDETLEVLNFVFKEYYDLMEFIMKDHTDTADYTYDEESLIKRLKNWLSFYIILTNDNLITPYVHIFVNHVPELIRLYKNLNIFSMQSLEYLNSRTKLHYFRNTNKQTKSVTTQLLQKQNRMEFINYRGTLDEIPESNIDISVIYEVSIAC